MGAESSAQELPAGWRMHERWLRTALHSRLRDAHAVDEVMQDVALAACSPQATSVTESLAAPWLYRVAIRQAAQYLRKRGRQRFHETRLAAQIPEGSVTQGSAAPADRNPLDWLLALERHALVREALRRLPPKDAEILTLKYTEDWSYREIAARLGLSESAVEARLHRARAKMRSLLASRDWDETQSVSEAKE